MGLHISDWKLTCIAAVHEPVAGKVNVPAGWYVAQEGSTARSRPEPISVEEPKAITL